MSGRTRFVINIERIVLDGLPLGPTGREQLRASLVAELAERLGGLEPGPLLAGGGAVPSLRAGSVNLASTAPAAMASQLAAAVTSVLATGGGR